jgi:hypothetical protein
VSVANEELWHCWPSSRNCSRALNNYELGPSHQTRLEKQISKPRFNNAVGWLAINRSSAIAPAGEAVAMMLSCAGMRWGKAPVKASSGNTEDRLILAMTLKAGVRNHAAPRFCPPCIATGRHLRLQLTATSRCTGNLPLVANCTAEPPTQPAAPCTSTFWPGIIRPLAQAVL